MNTCPECGGNLIKRKLRLCCEYCNYYEAVPRGNDKLIQFGFLDFAIDKPEFREIEQLKKEQYRNQFKSMKYNKKGELK